MAKMEASNSEGGFRGFDVLVYSGYVAVHLIHNWSDDAIKVVTTSPMGSDHLNHVCVTYDGSKKASGVRIYINGEPAELKVEHDRLQGTITNEVPFQVARRFGDSVYSGTTTDVRCFNREIDA